MSATELIKQVAALPQPEKRLFEELFYAMNNSSPPPAPPARSNKPDFAARLRAIYGQKVTPDSQSIIDDGRGER